MDDDEPVTSAGRTRAAAVLGLLAYVAGAALLAVAAAQHRPGGDPGNALIAATALPPTVVLGLLVTWRRADSPVGPALVGLAATPCLAWTLEAWLPPAAAAAVWVYNLTGFGLLCLVFPDGLLPGRFWRAMPWVFLAASVGLNIYGSIQFVVADGQDRGLLVLDVVVGLAFLAALGTSVGSLVVRYRRGDDLARMQLHWLILGAGSVPVLLAAGWAAEALTDAPTEIVYTGFLAAMLLFLPGTVAVAILRRDLLDIDRLLSESVSWLATTLVSAAAFAVVVLAVANLGVSTTGTAPGTQIGLTTAAFVAALVLLPAHRRIQAAVGRVLDRERTVTLATLREYVRQVRDGTAEPESVQDVLRSTLDDDGLRVLLRVPGNDGYVDLAGHPAAPAEGEGTIPLTAQGADVGAIVLGRRSARRLRLARFAAVEVRLPFEVSRLRLELRQALEDARASRARLVEAATDERRRLERDLHDGAQQRIVAVGMRLRSVQRRHSADDPVHQELDAAVAALEDVVGELRRLAHGIRPGRLDDGLDVALRDLVGSSPIPVEIRLSALQVSETVATTAYFVVAECLANTLKHAGATTAGVTIGQPDGGLGGPLTIEFTDDGCGGASSGLGLRALRDRVSALDGVFDVVSPPGGGTTVRVEI